MGAHQQARPHLCVACSQSFKDKILWEAHTSSRKHRYGITLLIMFEFH